jgi:RimJ/RimL family protein N-acetyltransferase
VEPVTPGDAQALTQAYVTAFGDGVEYCDWPEEKIREDASATIAGFLAGRHGAPLAASRLARDGAGSSAPVIGALLVIELGVDRALMDLLFVVPGRLRQGLASAMAASTLVALKEMGFRTLESRYLLANQASRAWHHRLGFEDLPDFMSARALLAHARHRLERHQIQGGTDTEALSQVKAEVAHWEAEVERLDAEETRRWRARHPA